MNIVDILILIFLGFGALIGFKKGFTNQLVSLIGIFVIIAFSFILKNPVSVFLYNNLPFINFGGIFKDLTVVNILFYEMIAFFVIFFILTIIFKILLKVTSVFEKILKFTIILGIPSKILGAVLGIIQNVIYAFIIIYILNLPTFYIKEVKESEIANIILDTPILASVCDKSMEVIEEITKLKDEYSETTNMGEYNQKVLNLMIDNGVITKENVKVLIDKGKLKGVTIS